MLLKNFFEESKLGNPIAAENKIVIGRVIVDAFSDSLHDRFLEVRRGSAGERYGS
jgi:hypothetical protein